MDPLEFLQTEDEFKRAVMQKTAQAAREIQRKHDLERANLHAHEIMKMLAASMKK
jgi:hypothetical protein